MSKGITRRSILGGRVRTPRPKDGGPAAYKRKKYNAAHDLKKYGLMAVEQVEIENPITHEKKMITIRRDGTNIAVLLEALANPKLTREQKDVALSMYLFERGKDQSSFLLDLFQYKGAHTKRTLHFQSQVRHDVDIMVQTFVLFMKDASERIFSGLHIELQDVEGKKIAKVPQNIELLDIVRTLGDLAFYFSQTADLMSLRMREEIDRREHEQGKGIYVDIKDKEYSIYRDSDVVDAVKRDQKQILEDKKEDHGKK